MMNPEARPIVSSIDPRLWGVTAIATDPKIPIEVQRWGGWVKAMMARGQEWKLIERASLELPAPIAVWEAMDRKTFDGMGTEEACIEMAGAAGWTRSKLLRETGLAQFSGYSALAVCTFVTIRAAKDQIFSWRTFSKVVERREQEGC